MSTDTSKLVGYCPDAALPFKRGDRALVPKGTPVRDRKGTKPAGRSQIVEVNHILSGQTWTMETIIKRPDGSLSHIPMNTTRGLLGLAKQLGIDFHNEHDLTETLRGIAHAEDCKTGEVVADLETAPPGTYYTKIHVSNPTVRWAGSNGYWREADINLVQKA